MPDDKTWTWDEMMQVAAEVARKAGVPFGVASMFGSDALFGTLVRQHGKELFTRTAWVSSAADAQAWFDLMVKFQKARAIGSPQQISEEAAKTLDQSALVVGNAGHAVLQLQSARSDQRCGRRSR